ncbi:MAG: ScyD/ScyE family protein [Gelidibacter sp.]
MKNSKMYSVAPKLIALISFTLLCFLYFGCNNDDDENLNVPQVEINTIASGLKGPMGIETDTQGNIWVTESGTNIPDADNDSHNNNGKVILITPNGQKYDAIVNLESYTNAHSGELQGTSHILRDGGILNVLSGNHLYRADISNFKPGDTPLDARNLPSEDIFSVISQLPAASNPDHDSHPYNLTKGPDGDLYITDAGANLIIHRKGVNDYSIFAQIPAIPNPSFPGLGGPTVQSVPTALYYDGEAFLVTSLTGFPFPKDVASIYKISLSGDVSVYQTGFTMLVDIVKGNNAYHLVAQHAASFTPASGFAPNTGSLVWVNGASTILLAEGLNKPSAIKQVDDHTWYVASLADGTVLKVTYQ